MPETAEARKVSVRELNRMPAYSGKWQSHGVLQATYHLSGCAFDWTTLMAAVSPDLEYAERKSKGEEPIGALVNFAYRGGLQMPLYEGDAVRIGNEEVCLTK